MKYWFEILVRSTWSLLCSFMPIQITNNDSFIIWIMSWMCACLLIVSAIMSFLWIQFPVKCMHPTTTVVADFDKQLQSVALNDGHSVKNNANPLLVQKTTMIPQAVHVWTVGADCCRKELPACCSTVSPAVMCSTDRCFNLLRDPLNAVGFIKQCN